MRSLAEEIWAPSQLVLSVACRVNYPTIHLMREATWHEAIQTARRIRHYGSSLLGQSTEGILLLILRRGSSGFGSLTLNMRVSCASRAQIELSGLSIIFENKQSIMSD